MRLNYGGVVMLNERVDDYTTHGLDPDLKKNLPVL